MRPLRRALRWGVVAGSVLAGAACAGQGEAHQEAAEPSYAPALAPAGPDDTIAVLVGAGDIASCERADDEATARILDTIPGMVFTAGDNAYGDGTRREFSRCYGPSWGRHKARTRPAPGNHDYHSRGARPYYEYFGANAGPAGRGYYSYDLGPWHIVSLNSEADMKLGSAQNRWLREDLAATTRRCVLAYWHHPRFSSSSAHGSQKETAPLFQALYDAGAEVVIAGHDHTYERFAKLAPDGSADPARGVRQFVAGTGGASAYDFGPPLPNSEVRYNATPGVIKFTLLPDRYEWEFIPVSGTFRDAGTAACHDPPSRPR